MSNTAVELIKINAETKAVSARELYEFLGATERFANWFERQKQYGFVENEDFTGVKLFTPVNNGAKQELQDYALTIDCAKEIAILQKTDKGKQARKYFLECEKQLKAMIVPKTTGEIIYAQAKANLEYERRLMSIEKTQITLTEKVAHIEAKQVTIETDFFTVAGWCTLNHKKIATSEAMTMGRACGKLSREQGIPIGKTHDAKYVQVNTYHKDIIQTIIDKI